MNPFVIIALIAGTGAVVAAAAGGKGSRSVPADAVEQGSILMEDNVSLVRWYTIQTFDRVQGWAAFPGEKFRNVYTGHSLRDALEETQRRALNMAQSAVSED